MSAAFKSSSCTVTEFPLPEREYRVAPPERRPSRSTSRSRRRRSPALPMLLLALLLFGSGFLLGLTAAAVGEENPAPPDPALAGPAVPQETGGKIIHVEPVIPAGQDGVRYLGMPASEGDGANGTPAPAVTEPDKDAWNLMLINGEHPLPEDFTVPERSDLGGGHSIDSRACPALQRMLEDARKAGFQPLVCSSFRTWDTQERLFANKVQRLRNQGYGPEEADLEAARWVARPGTSEHQAALAVDIVDVAYQMLDQAQEDRPVQQWLMAHCAEYGFILRYPTDKSELTGVGYEPWHYRYVGEEAARAIMDGGLCLEEYLAE